MGIKTRFHLTKQTLEIELLANNNEAPFELLQLADPSIQQINQYLKDGSCYLAKLNSETIGTFVLHSISPDSIEIKNIAIHPAHQGKGWGKQLLQQATEICRKNGYQKLVIGTGNSSINQLILYQKMGFEIRRIKENFFLENYDDPIFENGIQCKHMIVLEKVLLPQKAVKDN